MEDGGDDSDVCGDESISDDLFWDGIWRRLFGGG